MSLPLYCPGCMTPVPESDFDLAETGSQYNALDMTHHHAMEVPCTHCGRGLKVRAGILNILNGPPPYNDEQTEFDFSVSILRSSDTTNFAGVVEEYIHSCTHNPEEIKRLAIDNRLDAVNRGARMLLELEEMSDRIGYKADGSKEHDLGVLLDFGCGVGGQLVASAGRASTMIGIDAAFTELCLARRNLLDHGFHDRARLIVGYAEELPLPRCSVDTIIVRDTIEHFGDQRKALKRAWRALKPGGRLLLNSPNRYMMWYPEPHVELYMMGFMPRSWMPPYVKMRMGIPYVGCRLLGLGELMGMIGSLRPKPEKMAWKGNMPIGAQCPVQMEWAKNFVMNPDWNDAPLLRWYAPEHTVILTK